MSKKLLASVTFALATALTATAAFADQGPPAVAQLTDLRVADRRGNDVDVLDAQRAMGRAGSVTLSAPRGPRAGDLAIVASDPRLDLGRVLITYAGGKTAVLRTSAGGAIDLPDRGRIASIRVSYINRGARGAVVKLIARGDHRGDQRDPRDDRGRVDQRDQRDDRGHVDQRDGRGRR